ncbi:MAG: efflux RND transporter periplasmic adaptor subunit [Odoribacter sp.]
MFRSYCIFILVISLLFSCRKKESVPTQEIFRPVKTAKVETLGSINKQYTGTVEACQFSALAFKIAGTLIKLNTIEGQQVKKGEMIAQINPSDYQQQYRSSKANYEVAQSIFERTKRLYAVNAVALQNLEIAKADYIQASSALSIAQRMLDYTILTAPFDGFIEKQYVENHEEILTGEAIVKLVNPENIEIHFILPETSIPLLQIPKKIYVEFDTRKGQLFISEIKEHIYSSNGYGIPITLNITDKEFAPYRNVVYPGFSCKVYFEIDQMVSNNFIIPATALFEEKGNEYVWIIDPLTQTAHREKVASVRIDKQILIKEGLRSDDLIVIAGVASIQEGKKVSIKKENNN